MVWDQRCYRIRQTQPKLCVKYKTGVSIRQQLKARMRNENGLMSSVVLVIWAATVCKIPVMFLPNTQSRAGESDGNGSGS